MPKGKTSAEGTPTRENPPRIKAWTPRAVAKSGDDGSIGAIGRGVDDPQTRIQCKNQPMDDKGLITKAMKNSMVCQLWEGVTNARGRR